MCVCVCVCVFVVVAGCRNLATLGARVFGHEIPTRVWTSLGIKGVDWDREAAPCAVKLQ